MTPFSDRMARLRSAVVQHLSSETARCEGGEPFGVRFTRGARDAVDIVGGYSASCSLRIGDAPGLHQGSVLDIGGRLWVVASPVEPDETGWVTVQLQEAGHG